MTTDKQRAANRRNAHRSTGPKTERGVGVCKHNALRHGLRALQAVVPGEDPDEWEAHRAAVAADLAPAGAVELALVDQVAAKLWRLGRVIRHEVDLTANAQAADEVLTTHEVAHRRGGLGGPARTDIPARKDVADTKRAVSRAERDLSARDESLRLLEGLAAMGDEDALPSWDPLYANLREALQIPEDALDRLFEGATEEGPFLARHARTMLATGGAVAEITTIVVDDWRKGRADLEQKALRLRTTHRKLLNRYRAALERRRRTRGLPAREDLDRIQRYEAHLERGLHKALDRLRDLQEARGAVPPRGPAVALAVVRATQEPAAEDRMGPFGSFVPEAADGARALAELAGAGGGGDNR
jgi:hypothetical protein